MSHETRYDTRAAKSEKILSILRDYLGEDLCQMDCLDVGCASGAISSLAAGHFKSLIGIDLDTSAIQQAVSNHTGDQMHFSLASGHEIPFSTEAFDVVMCAQVYEHSTDQKALAAEIWRVLKPGGVCFFSGPNRLKVMEEHYWLPFLSWLPRPLADRYMRLFRRGKAYDAYPLFYWQIRDLWKRFKVIDYTSRMLQEPEKYAMQNRLGRLSWLKNTPTCIITLLLPIYPNYNWILVKE